MSCSEFEGEALPYLVDSDFEFLLAGRWDRGGLLEIYYKKSLVELIWLPLTKWAVLTLLALSGKYAKSSGWLRAFMSVDEIQHELKKRTHLEVSDPNRVVRNVFETRKLLNGAAAGKLQHELAPDANKWGKCVIESRRFGYRLSVPPENVRIEILGGYDTDENALSI
ncbi:MAG: hypothetical protein H8E44_43050 [Planctomycetes bacterium]|nr:hypothetical protein [Planctomycetota bacterium]MBL7040151.1 hypothetical protein [Pirellulaceae bacterium]